MKKLKQILAVTAGLGLAVAALSLWPAGRQALAQDATIAAEVYLDHGGNQLNIKSGGILQVYSGGLIDASAATVKSGTLTAATSQIGPLPAAQVLAGGDTIAADACGGIKQVTSTAARATSASAPFPAAAAGNAGCVMDVLNASQYAITVKYVANSYNWAGAADVVLGSSDTVRVGSNGSAWFQIGATGNN